MRSDSEVGAVRDSSSTAPTATVTGERCAPSAAPAVAEIFDAPVRLFLIRHGVTVSNLAKVMQGSLDSELSELGLRQAEELGDHLAGERIDAIYASDLKRSILTAEAVGRRYPGHEIKIDPRVREIDNGELEGKSWEENQARWPEVCHIMFAAPHLYQAPSGESSLDVQTRAVDFLREILPAHSGQTVAVVTHGYLLNTLFHYFSGEPFEDLGTKIPGNCSVSEFIFRSLTDFDIVSLDRRDHLTTET